MSKRLLLLPLLVSVTCPVAWAQSPTGAEFQVNTFTTNAQRGAAVTSNANGDFVVVWHGKDGSNNFYDVVGQRFTASGLPQGSEFQINSYTTGDPWKPAVASDANGNFVVVWQDGSVGTGVFGQRFNASGFPQGGEFQANTFTTTNAECDPAAASDPNGNFVVVWRRDFQGGMSKRIVGQRFSASGLPQGGEFQVGSYTASRQYSPAVASDASGSFVVVWYSYGQDGSGTGVFGQRFNASGLPQGTEFHVNSYTTGQQWKPAVASDASGNFVVVWHSLDQDGSGYGVFGQRFNAAGLPQGSEFQVNSYTTGTQWKPAVGSDGNWSFVVVWHSNGQDGSSDGVFGQRFTASGLPQGSEFQVNSYTTDNQRYSVVASDANGNFVVVWESYGQDGSSSGVFGQRYGDLIFKDGFQ